MPKLPPSLDEWITQTFEGSPPTFDELSDSELDSQVNWQVDLATQFILDPSFVIARYPIPVLDRGMWGLISAWELQDRLWDPDVPWAPRLACIQAMLPLFRDLFARVPLEDSAFMWFDQLRSYGQHPDRRTHDAMIAVCSQVLRLPNSRCQWAALHGLGHLRGTTKRQTIEYFLTRSDLPDDMREYAKHARDDAVL